MKAEKINIPAGMSTEFVGYTELESKSKIIFVHEK